MPPVIESIADNIVTTLAGVTTGNGYSHTLASVSRARIQPPRVEHLGAIVYLPAVVEPETPSQAYHHWEQMVAIEVTILEDSDDVPMDTLMVEVRSDIEKALLVDTTRGGKAHDTKLKGAQAIPYDNEPGGVLEVAVAVEYRTQYGDPDTVVG